MSVTLHARSLTRRVPLQSVHQHRCSSVQVAAHQDAPVSAKWANARPYSEIPGPRPLPLIGNAWRFMPFIGTIPPEFSDWLKQMQKYGPISKLTNIPGKRDFVFLFDPHDFETAFRNEGQWPERLMQEALPYYRQVTRKDFFQGVGGLIVENDEEWQKSRTYVNPVMMQPRNSRNYATRIDDISQEFVSKIPGMLDANKETPADFIKEIQKWALESISMVALDTRLGCLQSNLPADSEPYRLIHAADEIVELFFTLNLKFPLWKFVSTPSWRRFVRTLDFFTEVCMRHIENAQRRLKEKPHQDETEMSVLEKLLLRDPNPKKAVVMALDMMMAGIDTTSFTTGCVLYHLARNPEQQERLFSELKQKMPSPDSPLTADVLEDLKLNPISVIGARLAKQDMVLSNYQIPKGTDLLMGNWLVTTSEDHFPKASSFLPERWLKNSGSCPVHGEHKPHPFAFMPFGYGKRNCIGMRFALLEIETLVARVVRKYRLEWHHPEMRFRSMAIYAPNDPLRIRFSSRE
ncbi:hypothetical protein B566_EDAN012001 [Ephemera danica]|nr:hypothetical protein B566_EDAN012001 [Ephemera danica]